MNSDSCGSHNWTESLSLDEGFHLASTCSFQGLAPLWNLQSARSASKQLETLSA